MLNYYLENDIYLNVNNNIKLHLNKNFITLVSFCFFSFLINLKIID